MIPETGAMVLGVTQLQIQHVNLVAREHLVARELSCIAGYVKVVVYLRFKKAA